VPAIAPASAGKGIQDAKSITNAHAPPMASSSVQESNWVINSQDEQQDIWILGFPNTNHNGLI
jgi:hypothetical protein